MIAFPDRGQQLDEAPVPLDHETDWQLLREQMIAQTQAFISEGLHHPEQAVVIPTIPAGSGAFPKNWSLYFWQRVLGDV